jgi:hypothetical protein
MDEDYQQGLLDRFLVRNAELEQLNARLSAFNLFQVLRIEKAELRHSNVLAWLLDPSETHGLGAIFLKRFVTSILLEQDVPGVSLTPAQLELAPIAEVEVYRERHHIDILVRCLCGRGPAATRWCLLVENKIGAKESDGQLATYRDAVAGEFPNEQIIPIFLTLDGDDPSEDGENAGFVPVAHAHILETVESVIGQHRTRIPNDAQVFLEHYVDSLRRLTMPDDKIIELCKQIYRTHREAIDLIVEHGASSEVYDTCANEIAKLVNCEFTPFYSRYRVWFIPKKLGEVMPTAEMAGWKFLPRPIPACFWLRYSRKKLRAQITLEIGPVADKALRMRILESAKANGLDVKQKHFETAKYARLVTESMPLQEDPETGEAEQSEEYIRKICEQLWSKVWPKAQAIISAMAAIMS